MKSLPGVLGVLCLVFAVVDFSGMYLHYDLTGVSWSPAVAGLLGIVLIVVAPAQKTRPAKTAQEGQVGPNAHGAKAPMAPGIRSRNGVKSEPRAAYAIDGGCSECDSPLLEGAKFCGECGAILAPPPTIEAGKGCPVCSVPAQAGDRFCRECGFVLSGEAG